MAHAAGTSQSAPAPMVMVIGEITNCRNDEILNETLRECVKESYDLSSLLPDGQDPLDILIVPENTLGLLYILSARINSRNTESLPRLDTLSNFCAGFDPARARLAPERVTMLAKGIFNQYKASNQLEACIPLLHELITGFPPHLSYLTTLHPIFIRACTAVQYYKAALTVLSEPITQIDRTLSDLHYNDNLVYHYAGGMVYAALKRWAEAEDFFETVVGSPAQVPSAIQFEALKKMALVQLIAYGKLRELPKYANTSLIRHFKNSVYGSFVNSYPLQTSELERLFEKEASTFEADKNIGLIKQAIRRSRSWSIKKLTETYISLSLSEIGQQINVTDEKLVRKLVLGMIAEGEIDGSISADGTVIFNDSVPTFSKGQMEAMLIDAQQQAAILTELDRKVGRSKEFLSKAVKSRDDGWGNDEDVLRAEKAENWAEETLFS